MTKYTITYNFETLPGENPDQVAGYLLQQSNLPIIAIHYPTADNPYYSITADITDNSPVRDAFNMIRGALGVCRAMIEIGKRRPDTARYALLINLIQVDSAGKQTAILGSKTTDVVSSDLGGIEITFNYLHNQLCECMTENQTPELLTDRHTGAPAFYADDEE